MPTIAISGASGFIGRALTEFLRARGDTVVALVRPPRGRNDGIPWDPLANYVDTPALEGLDAVVHLAGEGIAEARWSPAQKERIRSSRVDGTALLANALAKTARPPRVFVSGSAIGIYGDRGDETLDERSGPGSDFLSEVGVAWEGAAEPARAVGIRVVHPRTGVVLDPSGGALARMLLPFRMGVGGQIGSGAQWMSWIALEDAVAALAFAVDCPDAEGPINLSAPEPVTNRTFSKALARALHRPALFAVPGFAARLAFGELADAALLSSARVLPTRLLALGYSFRYASLDAYLAAAFGAR